MKAPAPRMGSVPEPPKPKSVGLVCIFCGKRDEAGTTISVCSPMGDFTGLRVCHGCRGKHVINDLYNYVMTDLVDNFTE